VTRATWALWILVLSAGTTAVAVAGRAAAHAEVNARREIQRLDLLVDQTRTLIQFRPSTPRRTDVPAPDGGLAPSLTAALASCGLPPSTLGSLAPESQSANIGPLKVQHQRATMALSPITLPQLGAFLEAWGRREPAWAPSSIEIVPENRPAMPGADLPLRVIISLESIHVQSGGDH
jgi:hypothetical protein